MTIYQTVAAIHNLTRWAVLLAGAFALFRAATGLLAKGGWLSADDKARKFFPIALDIQVTLGTLLAILSPVVHRAWSDIGTALDDRSMRLYAIEHPMIAIAAIAIAHIGSSKIRKLKDARSRFKTMAVFFGLALLLLVARMPSWELPHFQ